MSPKRTMERRNHGCAMRQHGKNRKWLAETRARGGDALRMPVKLEFGETLHHN